MVNKKIAPKVKKVVHPKMDRKLVSSEPHEVQYLREKYYKVHGNGNIEHPTGKVIKALIKQSNNSRLRIARHLIDNGYKAFRAK